jgi:hypothetical protein
MRQKWAVAGLALLLAIATIGTPSMAQVRPEVYTDDQGYLGAMKGPAAQVIRTYLERTKLDCSDRDGNEAECTLAERALGVSVEYGRPKGSDATLAFVIATWVPDPTGNAWQNEAIVFKADAEGAFRLLGRLPIYGQDFRDTKFDPDQIRYTATVPRDSDPRCCPTGKRSFVVKLTPKGPQLTQ